MKNLFKGYIFALLIFISILPSYIYANHIQGADITWKHYSKDSFLFTASVYRSCTGMNLANSPFSYFGTSPGYTTTKTIYGSLCCTKDVTPGNYGCDQCSDPSCAYPFGTQLITEEVKIAFPSGCCDWFVSWQQNYRDGSINTIASGETFYVEAEINTCLSRQDNSPTFNSPANNIFCVGQCNTMDNSASDIDRSSTNQKDSLVYSLVAPLQAHGKPVTYAKGYSYLVPMILPTDLAACIGFHLDPKTGILQFEPKLLEISVFAIQVDELRQDTNGYYQKIGSIRRDIETYTVSCPSNSPPIIPGINGGNSFSEKICGGEQTCFEVLAFDLDPPDSVKLSWNGPGEMKGSTFTVVPDGKKWPTAVFCWYPVDSQARTQPYTFTATAKNNNIPPDSSSKTFTVYVIPYPKAIYSATVVKGGCGLVNFKASQDSSSLTSIFKYLWVGDSSPGLGPLYIIDQTGSYQYSRGGWHHYTLIITSLNGCNVSYTDSIYVAPSLEINLPHDTIVCAKSPYINLRANVAIGTPPYLYSWNTGETSQTKSAIITGDTTFKVTVSDAAGCRNYDSANIKFVTPPPPMPATIVYKCANSSTTLTSSDISSQVVWTAIIGGKIIPNYSDSNTLIVNDTGIYIATAQNSFVCPGVDSFIVRSVRETIRNYYDTICQGAGIIIGTTGNVAWIDSGMGWRIDSTQDNQIKLRYIQPKYKIKYLWNSYYNGTICLDTTIGNITVISPNADMIKKPLPELCIHDAPLNLNPFEKTGYTGGVWYYPGNLGPVYNTTLDLNYLGATSDDSNSGYLHYKFRNKYGCTLDDSARIIIWPKVYAGPDTALWKECGKYILNNDATPGFGGTWTALPGTPASCLENAGGTAMFDPDSVPGNGRYGFVYTYNNKADTAVCYGSDTVFITLAAKPVISISAIDTLCDDSDPYAIKVNPPGGYFEFTDSTSQGAVAGFEIIPIIAGPGYHHLRYVIRDIPGNPGCTDTAGIGFYIVKAPDPKFFTNDSIWQYCASHGPVKLAPVTPGGIFIGASYTRRDTAYFDPAIQGADSVAKTSLITYYLPYHNGSCGEVYSHNITVLPNPGLQIVSDTFICGTENVFTVHAVINNCPRYYWSAPDANGQDGGVFTYQASNNVGSNTILTVHFIPGAAQLKQKYFTLYLTGWGSGCDTVHTKLKIHIKPGPQPSFISLEGFGCDPLTEQFRNRSYDSSSTIIEYDWDFGDSSPVSNDANPVHLYHAIPGDSIGIYNVKLTAISADGCSNTKGVNSVGVYADPVPVITADPTFTTLDKPKVQFSLSPQSRWLDPNDSTNLYLWHFIPQGLDTGGYSTLAGPQHIYMDTGKFTVTLKLTVDDGYNCTGTDSAYAIVDIRPTFAIYIPNVFLPASKFIKNQTFKPVMSSDSDFSMTIFSRWGNVVCQTSDAINGWDGTIRGHMAPSGVYFYKIEVKDRYGKTYKYSGNVTLMR